MKEHGGNRRGWMRHVIAYGVAMPWLLFAPCLLHAVTCPGDLARKEIEGVVYGDGLDGAVIDVLRRLEDPSARVDALGTPSTNLASYDVPFWIPGPIKTDLDTWYEFNCDDTGTPCPAPTGFDEVDDVLEEFTTFVDLSKSLAQQPMDETVSTMESWSRWFYDPSSQADYYDVLFRLIEGDSSLKYIGIKGWKQQLQMMQQTLPSCICPTPPCQVSGGIQNYPCREGTFASTDEDAVDEFAEAQQKLDTLITNMETFRVASKQLYDDMKAVFAQMGAGLGGINPITYAWKDSAGDHFVKVEVSDFTIPEIKKKKKGGVFNRKICMVIDGVSDDGTNTWVNVTRQDPSKGIGPWRWNPFGGAVTKRGCASYSFDHVELAPCR